MYCIQKELVPELPQAISVGTGSVQVYCIQKQSVPRLPQAVTVGTGSVYAKKFPTWEILGANDHRSKNDQFSLQI